jgi:hypothetical protein
MNLVDVYEDNDKVYLLLNNGIYVMSLKNKF